jgi:hypothetical protein
VAACQIGGDRRSGGNRLWICWPLSIPTLASLTAPFDNGDEKRNLDA